MSLHRDSIYCECENARVPKAWCDCVGGERIGRPTPRAVE